MEKNGHISWDEYFMGICILSSFRSKDPWKQTGACIVQNKIILGVGYNGLPRNIEDSDFYWSEDRDRRHDYVVHAELNAILNSRADLENSTIYCSLFPCKDCCKAIIQKGIKKVVYFYFQKSKTLSNKAALLMFKNAKVEVVDFNKLFQKSQFIKNLIGFQKLNLKKNFELEDKFGFN